MQVCSSVGDKGPRRLRVGVGRRATPWLTKVVRRRRVVGRPSVRDERGGGRGARGRKESTKIERDFLGFGWDFFRAYGFLCELWWYEWQKTKKVEGRGA